MDNICKAYVSQVKAILPIWGKKEKAFVKKLHDNLCDYCEDNNTTAIDELYKGFGTPQEIVFDYISLMKPNEISKRINIAKYIKILVIGLLTFTLIVTTFFGFYAYSEYKIAKKFEDNSIEHIIREFE